MNETMRKNYNQEETQQKCHQASEPVVAYGTEKHEMTPEELYSVIVADVKAIVQEDIKTDERGRIILTEEMKNSLHKAQQSLEEGRCLNQEMFRKRFAKWL